MRIMTLATLLVTVVLLSACNTPTAEDEQMTVTEIKSELLDVNLAYTGAFSGSITYHSDGTLDYTANGSPFSGRWRFQGDKMCTVLSSAIRGGRESCFNWFRTGNGQYRTSLGYRAWRR